ncbi:hypothetical protein [Adlercreutzia caecimuris]|uniref:hypothetical protein n=1 Tax=Adlercreutzia caecimuris TaxID=671266 RepID=UPI0025833DC1|nr:hypothetical protein [Adlercreutzia caecimuris]
MAALAAALALLVAVGGIGVAWADDPINQLEDVTTNQDVPTDETGVVDPSAKDDGSDPSGTAPTDGVGPESQGSAGAADGPAGVAPPKGEGDDPAQNADGEASSEGTHGEEAPMPPPLPDPVFGGGVSENNLMNPQQKPDSSFIYDTSIGALQEADSYLNNQIVQVTGEVVGDRINAEFNPGFCWIVLQGNDKGRSEVPVFIAKDATDGIDTYGAYGRRGTMLQIRGIFYLSCPEHQGLTDLHADTVSVVEKGSVTEQVFDIGAFLPGLGLVVLGTIMILVFHRMREGQR